MQRADTVVIGGGQAGLAVSWELTQRSHDHVVLERGQVANRWRTGGWDSLRMLTPNWMSRLPGRSYAGGDPDGFQSAAELVDYLQAYAESFTAPVSVGTGVYSVRRNGDGYRVDTNQGRWSARAVVIATGACGSAYVPELSAHLAGGIHQLTPDQYRNPKALPEGGVLIVGGAASGVQIAQELRRSGRPVTLSTGRHVRVPRTYRGMDIWWWLEQLGRLDRSIEEVARPERARREPSLQLVGRPGEDLDLAVLAREGVTIAGRLIAAEGSRVGFAADLSRSAAAADTKLRRLLDAIDSHIGAHGLRDEVLAPAPYQPFRLPSGPRELDLHRAGVGTVIWATGCRPSYPWLRVPVLDAQGEIRQRRGATHEPGLYAVGLRWGQRRNSSLLDGARHDAAAVVADLSGARRGNAQAPAGGTGDPAGQPRPARITA